MSYKYPSVVTLSKLHGRSLRRPIPGTSHHTASVFTDLGQAIPITTTTGHAPPTRPNWHGLGILAAVGLVPAGIAGAMTRSKKKAAITGVAAVGALLLLQPLIPFAGSDRTIWFVNRTGWHA